MQVKQISWEGNEKAAQSQVKALEENERALKVAAGLSHSIENNQRLAPGMFAEVLWPVSRFPLIVCPPQSIAVTTERAFVVRIRNGVVEWVDAKRVASMRQNDKDLVEVFGDLEEGDQIAVPWNGRVTGWDSRNQQTVKMSITNPNYVLNHINHTQKGGILNDLETHALQRTK